MRFLITRGDGEVAIVVATQVPTKFRAVETAILIVVGGIIKPGNRCESEGKIREIADVLAKENRLTGKQFEELMETD